jgi:CheY-like chemotaxis protein
MSRTILLADDSVTIQKVIELTFMDEDYEVVAVGNGDEALEKLEEVTPDFVIADVHMPGASGYDVAKHSKSLRPEIPVLLLVGTFEPFDEEQAERSGCDAFLKKPFDSQELQRLVEELSSEAAGEATTVEEPPAWETGSSDDEPEEAQGAEPRAGSEPFAIGLDDETRPETLVEPPELPDVAPIEEVGEVEEIELETDEASVESSWGAEATPASAAGFESEPPEPALRAEEPPPPTPAPEAAPEAAEPTAASGEAPAVAGLLSDDDVDRIARRLLELVGDKPVRDVAWEVVPDLAEVVIRNRLRELETQVESAE